VLTESDIKLTNNYISTNIRVFALSNFPDISVPSNFPGFLSFWGLIECLRFQISRKFPLLQISRDSWFLGAGSTSEISKPSVCADGKFLDLRFRFFFDEDFFGTSTSTFDFDFRLRFRLRLGVYTTQSTS
jgi:hypothetical protein